MIIETEERYCHEKSSGFVLTHKDLTRTSVFKRFLDAINPYSSTSVLTNKELEALKTENFKLTSQKEVLVKAIGGNAEITQKLLDAYVIYSLGDKEAANAKISNLNTALLNQMQLNIYNTIIGE